MQTCLRPKDLLLEVAHSLPTSIADLGSLISEENAPSTYMPHDIKRMMTARIPQDLIQHLHDHFLAFRVLDKQTGYIGIAELSYGMYMLGQSYSFAEIRALVHRLAPKDNRLNFVEFCRVSRSKFINVSPLAFEATTRGLFEKYDRDQDGYLNENEIEKLFKKCHCDIKASEIIQLGTSNQAGLSFLEFHKMISESSDPKFSIWRILKVLMLFSCDWEATSKDVKDLQSLMEKSTKAGESIKVISLIRHGQSEANLACDLYGHAKGYFDPILSKTGREQAISLGEALSTNPHFNFDLIVVSPMQRTLETLDLVIDPALRKSVPIIALPWLCEQVSQDDDIGHSLEFLKSKHPDIDWSYMNDLPEVWWYPGPSVPPEKLHEQTMESQRALFAQQPWEEPWERVLQRADRFERWLRASSAKNICVFSHGGFIAAMIGKTLRNADHCILTLSH
jgi:broad specificity phosphatase PhoE/Ca2+-binding EF-hand superfamily protein